MALDRVNGARTMSEIAQEVADLRWALWLIAGALVFITVMFVPMVSHIVMALDRLTAAVAQRQDQ